MIDACVSNPSNHNCGHYLVRFQLFLLCRYNLLQLAVKKGDIAFVEYLLRDKKINPNVVKCSLPLHIALNIG